MKVLRISTKLLALIVLLFVGVILMMVTAFSQREQKGLINDLEKSIRKRWLTWVINVVGIDLDIQGEIPKPDENALWVANHISWLDIPVIGSAGVGFLSKSEVRKWPLVGWLGHRAGTVFINRGGKNASQIASREIAEKIKTNDSILVFPEGTTGYGDIVMRFHARIFAPAMDHQIPVQPLAIQYLDQYGNHFRGAAWVKESFLHNLFRVLGAKRILVKMIFLPMIDSRQFDQRRNLARHAEQLIRHEVESFHTKGE